MKLRWRIATAVVVLAGVGAYFLFRSDHSAERALAETRNTLRQQGFKVDLAEFNLSTTPENEKRAYALCRVNINPNAVPHVTTWQFPVHDFNNLKTMVPVGSNSVRVIWKDRGLEEDVSKEVWSMLRSREIAAELDAACEAALSGPIAFPLNALDGNGMLLPHLAVLKSRASIFTARALLELHEGNRDAAWTNLLAATRLATAYSPEPAEVSHLLRFSCAQIVFNTTWQLLQEQMWTESQLATLQREWESADYLRDLPEAIAFTRASMAASCQDERQQPTGFNLKALLQSPRFGWSGIKHHWEQLRYRNFGSYEDEKALLLHFRDREIEMRRAVQTGTWAEMRELPGVTNTASFQSQYNSRTVSMMNLKQMGLGIRRGGAGTLDRAANAEARRRLIIAALALERFRLREGSYPERLEQLNPAFVTGVPADFIDGKPLRYSHHGDAFLLYSIGLDGVDNGGTLPRRPRMGVPFEPDVEMPGMGPARESDIVWPLAAAAGEVEALQRQEAIQWRRQNEKSDMQQAIWRWRRTADRQTQVENLLATLTPSTNQAVFEGRPLTDILRNEATTTANITLAQLLTLQQVITGNEPETVTFELPISYTKLTNVGDLHLLVDPANEEDDFDDGTTAVFQECKGATNGNCLLVWETGFDAPGKHALQAWLVLHERKGREFVTAEGPLLPFFSSNICQYSEASAHFDHRYGATLQAKVPEPNATYSVDFKTADGRHLRTLKGQTSNGVITVHWDLSDDDGRKLADNYFQTVFHVTLPDSGRTQSQRGP